MSDMIPASKVAAAALHQVRQASECFPTSYHESEKAAKGKVHLQVASELLGLIAEQQIMVNVKADGTMEPLTPPPQKPTR